MGDRAGSIPVIRTSFENVGAFELQGFRRFFFALKFVIFLRTVENNLMLVHN